MVQPSLERRLSWLKVQTFWGGDKDKRELMTDINVNLQQEISSTGCSRAWLARDP